MNDKRRQSASTAADPMVAARARFPGAERLTYMNVAARGLLGRDVREAVDAYLDARMYEGGEKSAMFEAVATARERFATLVRCDTDEVAITKNVSEGLNIVASALPWEPGDNVLTSLGLEHANNVYPWYNLRERVGIEVRDIPSETGHMPVEAMIEAMDDRTRAVSVSTISFAPGFVTPMEALAGACRERDVFLLVDAAQSVGNMDTDVVKLGVDALATSTQKGLLSFYGMGFLYCRRERADRLTPAYLARFGVDLGDLDETAIGGGNYRLMPAARRFDLGNYNFLAATAVAASLGMLLDIGTEAIEAHVTGLAHRLARGMLELDLTVCGGEPGPHIGTIVSVGELGAGHDQSTNPDMDSLYRYLMEHGVRLSIRRDVLRFALHLYNDENDVDRVLELTRAWQRSRDFRRLAAP